MNPWVSPHFLVGCLSTDYPIDGRQIAERPTVNNVAQAVHLEQFDTPLEGREKIASACLLKSTKAADEYFECNCHITGQMCTIFAN
jgi:hypothetical protein